MSRHLTDKELIKEIYWTIGRADPTDADLRGAAKQVALLIEQERSGYAKEICTAMQWPLRSLFSSTKS